MGNKIDIESIKLAAKYSNALANGARKLDVYYNPENGLVTCTIFPVFSDGKSVYVTTLYKPVTAHKLRAIIETLININA